MDSGTVGRARSAVPLHHAAQPLERLDAIVQAYRLYNDHIEAFEMEQVLSLTRAWTLIRFFDAKLLQSAKCTCCGGEFVVHAFDPTGHYVCGLCHVPSRAGKTKKAAAAEENPLP